MELRLDGKVALVTGASKGIGRAIALALAQAGAKVMLCSRKADLLDEVKGQIEKAGGRAAVHAAHAGKPEDAQAAVAAAVSELGSCDVLVNNAATNPYLGPALDISLEAYDKTFEVNTRGAFVWSQQAHRQWMAEHGGTILNIASIGGLTTERYLAIYNTSKAALIYLTRALATELGPKVRVNGIAPGLVKTDMARALWESREAQLSKGFPLGRLGEPEDVAHAALFLASDAASWITGHTLVVDGGALVASQVQVGD